MGESISNQINIYVESGDAQKQYDALATKNKTLQTEVENLRIKQAKANEDLRNGVEGAAKSVASLNEQLRDVNTKLQASTEAMDRQAKKVSGELSPSIRDLENSIRKLSAAQKLSSEQDPGYKERATQLEQYRAALDQVKISTGLLAAKMKEEKEHAGEWKKHLLEIAGGVGLVTSAEAGLEKGVELIKESVKLELEREKGLKRLEVAINNWGNNSEGALERFNVKAEETAKKFGYLLPAEITQVQQKLVTFGRLSEEQINELLPVIINFSAQTGKSMEESSKDILSAFEGNGRALKQYGIELKKDEGFAVNYGIVMDQLASKVDGAAEAFANSSAGQLATYSKNIEELKEDIGKGLIPILVEMSKGGIAAINALRELPRFISENRQSIILLVGAYALYNSALIANTLQKGYNTAATLFNTTVERGAALAKGISAAATNVLQLGYAVLTGNISLATAATIAFEAASAAATGGLTLIVGAVVAAGTALAVYATRMTEVEKTEKMLGEIREKAVESVAKEKVELEELVRIARSETSTKEKKLEAIQRLNEISPEYLGTITEENIKTKETTEAIDRYIKSLESKATAQAAENMLVDIESDKLKLQLKAQEALQEYEKSGDEDALSRRAGLLQDIEAIEKKKKAIEDLKEASIEQKDKEDPYAKNAEQLAAIDEFYAQAQKARADFDAITAESDAAEANRAAQAIKDLNDKLEEMRHDGLITLKQYYDAKQLLSKDDAYKEMADAIKRSEDEAKRKEEQHKKRLEELKKLQEELYTQSELARNKNLSAEDKELADLAVKYQEQETQLKKFLDDKTIMEQEYNKTLLQIQANQAEEEKALKDKAAKAEADKAYEDALRLQEIILTAAKAFEKEKLVNGISTQEEYNRAIMALELQDLTTKATIATQYAAISEKAKNDEVVATQKALDKELDLQILHEKEVKASQDFILAEKKKQIIAEGKDDSDSLKGKLAILKEEMEAKKKAHKDNAAEIAQIEATYSAQAAALVKEAWKKELKTVNEYVQSVGGAIVSIMGTIADIQKNKEDEQLARDKKANSLMVKQYEDQVAKKQMTREQADKLEQQASEALAKKEDELKKKQFESDKKMKMATTAMNTAMAVMNAFATVAFPMDYVAAAIAVATGIAQEAKIASQNYVSSMADGGEIRGVKHSHSSGGNAVIDGATGRVIHKVEAGEHVIPADATQNNPEIINMLKSQGRNRNIKDMLAPASSVNSERAIDTIHQSQTGYHQSSSATGAGGSGGAGHIDTSKIESLLSKSNELHEQHIQVSKVVAAKPNITIHDIHHHERTEQMMLSQQL